MVRTIRLIAVTATTQDDTEPYIWHPGTNARYGASEQIGEWIIDFESAYLSDNSIRATIRLDDGGVSPLLTSPTLSGALSGDLSATATLGTTPAATVIHTFDGGLDGSISINAAVGGAPAISTSHAFSGALSGDLSATATLGAGAIVFELPEPTHFTDGTNNRLAWNYAAGSRPDWSALSALGEPAFGGSFSVDEDIGRIRLFIAPDQTTGIFVAGPELSDAFELYNSAITITVPGLDAFVIGGPNDPANNGAGTPQDPTEPYNWFPGTNARYGESGSLTDWVTDFVAAYGLDNTLRATLRLDDGGIDPLSTSHTLSGALSGDLSVTVTLGPASALTTSHSFSGTLSGDLSATATLGDTPLVLSDFTAPSGHRTVFAALIEIGVSGEDRYRPGSSVGALLDGNLNVTSDIDINRIRVRSGPRITLNRTGSGGFDTVLETGGDLNDGVFYLQSVDGINSVDVADIPASDLFSGSANIRNTTDADMVQRLEDRVAGDRLIVAMTEPLDSLSANHTFNGDLTGDLSTTASVGDSPALTTPYTFDGELVGTLSATAILSAETTVTASFYVSGAARTVYQNGAARSVYRDGTLYVDAA